MTYDPRQGESPYLGMDADDTTGTGMFQPVASRPGVASGAERPVASGTLAAASAASREVPMTVRRPAGAPQRGVAPAAGVPQRGAGMRDDRVAPRAIPSPRQQRPYIEAAPPLRVPSVRTSGPLAALGSFALSALALVLRLCAIALSLLVLASAMPAGAHRIQLVEVLNAVSSFVPRGLAGQFVRETPLGGALRGDFVILSVALFVADWICTVYAASLHRGERRS